MTILFILFPLFYFHFLFLSLSSFLHISFIHSFILSFPPPVPTLISILSPTPLPLLSSCVLFFLLPSMSVHLLPSTVHTHTASAQDTHTHAHTADVALTLTADHTTRDTHSTTHTQHKTHTAQDTHTHTRLCVFCVRHPTQRRLHVCGLLQTKAALLYSVTDADISRCVHSPLHRCC